MITVDTPISDEPTITFTVYPSAEQIRFDANNFLFQQLSVGMDDLNTHIKTLLDASIPNKDQNRALKSMIDERCSAVLTRLHDLAFPPIVGMTDPQSQKQPG